MLCKNVYIKWHIKDHKRPFYEFTKVFFDGISRFRDNWNTVKRGEFAKSRGKRSLLAEYDFVKNMFSQFT